MKQDIQHLNRIANQPSRLIIGLMSGTSLDGLDVALCRLTGSGPGTGVEIIEFDTVTYDSDFKTEIREVFAKKLADLEKVCLLNAWIGREHGKMILDCLQRWKIAPADVDLIASHGQTIYHAPKILHQLDKFPNATLQIGDGDHLAVTTGIITLCDFRQSILPRAGKARRWPLTAIFSSSAKRVKTGSCSISAASPTSPTCQATSTLHPYSVPTPALAIP
jgi:anhydro-N-acetylmuramic acid kinase